MFRSVRNPSPYVVLFAFVALAAVSACGFTAPSTPPNLCESFDRIPLAEVVGGPPAVVLEDPGTIKVMHGDGSASFPSGDPGRVQQSVELPPYANQATVFLNGWDLAYKGTDHHVEMLANLIARIRVERGKITWDAAAVLADDDFDKPVAWKYRYTVIAWNDVNLRAMVDHNDIDHCKSGTEDASDNYFSAGNDNMPTALNSVLSVLQNPGFASGRKVAVVPRGQGFGWPGEDHHLLQLSYNLQSSESFVHHDTYQKGYSRINPVPSPAPAKAGSDFVTWQIETILKDDSARRAVRFAELVSAIGGADVDLIQPAFTLQPLSPANGGLGGAGLKTAQVVIANVPYAYAVPMLTGWNIGYAMSDQHVKEIGVWLDNVHYDRLPGASTGTLRYTINSILKDNDTFPDNFYTHKVTVLGFKPLSGGVTGTDTPRTVK